MDCRRTLDDYKSGRNKAGETFTLNKRTEKEFIVGFFREYNIDFLGCSHSCQDKGRTQNSMSYCSLLSPILEPAMGIKNAQPEPALIEEPAMA